MESSTAQFLWRQFASVQLPRLQQTPSDARVSVREKTPCACHAYNYMSLRPFYLKVCHLG